MKRVQRTKRLNNDCQDNEEDNEDRDDDCLEDEADENYENRLLKSEIKLMKRVYRMNVTKTRQLSLIGRVPGCALSLSSKKRQNWTHL